MLKRITTTLIFCFLLGNIFSLCCSNQVSAFDFEPQVTVGSFEAGNKVTVDGTTLGKYIREIYKYSLGFVGILACAVLMFGGFSWITAGGNGERIGNAKSWIGAALSGLVLMLCSYTLLYMVNPDLVSFKPLDVREVDGKTSTDDDNENPGITPTCSIGEEIFLDTDDRPEANTQCESMNADGRITEHQTAFDGRHLYCCVWTENLETDSCARASRQPAFATDMLSNCKFPCGDNQYDYEIIDNGPSTGADIICCTCKIGSIGDRCGDRNNCDIGLTCRDGFCIDPDNMTDYCAYDEYNGFGSQCNYCSDGVSQFDCENTSPYTDDGSEWGQGLPCPTDLSSTNCNP